MKWYAINPFSENACWSDAPSLASSVTESEVRGDATVWGWGKHRPLPLWGVPAPPPSSLHVSFRAAWVTQRQRREQIQLGKDREKVLSGANSWRALCHWPGLQCPGPQRSQRTAAAEAAGADDIECQQAENQERREREPGKRSIPRPQPVLPSSNRCPSHPLSSWECLKILTFSNGQLSLPPTFSFWIPTLLLRHGIFPVLRGFFS